MDRIASLRETLERRFAPEHLEIEDESARHVGHREAAGGGSHFRVVLVCAAFRDQTLLSRHRVVYAALDEPMKVDIHALALETLTPEEWVSRRQTGTSTS